jgi:hypothetical protein
MFVCDKLRIALYELSRYQILCAYMPDGKYEVLCHAFWAARQKRHLKTIDFTSYKM